METTPNDLKNGLGTMKDNVRQGANSMKQSVQNKIEDASWKNQYEAIQDRTREAVEASSDFVKAHPYYSILGAAAVGITVGMLLRRR